MPDASAPLPVVRHRDSAASRLAILDAAEELFSARGFDRASLQAIGRRAGVSTALPAYFYAGKEGLYRAVLDRLLAEREARLTPVAAAAVAAREAGQGLRAALEILVGGYVDFLLERPALVRLMGREALDGGRRLGPAPRHSLAVQDGLERLAASVPPAPGVAGGGPAAEPDQLVITLVALCFFPIEHNDTMLAAMGLDALDGAFAAARQRHVVDVLTRVIGG
jgi:AcrR family transcriptional regulator